MREAQQSAARALSILKWRGKTKGTDFMVTANERLFLSGALNVEIRGHKAGGFFISDFFRLHWFQRFVSLSK
jgi:hypothetical protein